MENVEELMTTTILIGQAIAAVQFPGMYRLYDFHSKKAPKLKNGQPFRPFFNQDSDDEGGGASENAPDPSDYSHFFNVKVGEDVIYIEDVLESNEAGWLPLHACCMSLQTVDAGCRIIDEMVKRGSHLDHKTAMGPGTFNRGWTALQMYVRNKIKSLEKACRSDRIYTSSFFHTKSSNTMTYIFNNNFYFFIFLLLLKGMCIWSGTASREASGGGSRR